MMRQEVPFGDYLPDLSPLDSPGTAYINNVLPTKGNYGQSKALNLTSVGTPNAGSYITNAVTFNGTSNYLSRGADLTGNANGKQGLFSVWVKLGSLASNMHILGEAYFTSGANSGEGFLIKWLTDGSFRIFGRNSVLTDILHLYTSGSYSNETTWYNILASWDLSAGVGHLYINNTGDAATTLLTNDTIVYSGANCAIGAQSDSFVELFNGSMAELYFTNTYLDLSNSTNRAKFIDSNGYPVDLGADGSTPTGTSPLIYLKNSASTFGTNAGTGGNFTVNGTLAIASSTPSGATPIPYKGAISTFGSTETPHIYAGNASQLVEISVSTATDLSKSGGYTTSSDEYWKFAQYQNTVYATNYADAIQSMTVGGTAFADLAAAAPKAKCMGVVGQFLMVGNTNGGTYQGVTQGAVPYRVWWPKINDPTTWPDPSSTTATGDQSSLEDLNPVYGPVMHISNGTKYNLIFQRTGVTRADYIGGDVVFEFTQIEYKRGLAAPNAIVQLGDSIYYYSDSGFMMTNGSGIQPIGNDQVDITVANDLNTAYLSHMRASYDPATKCVRFAYVSTAAAALGSFIICDKVIAYNTVTGKWAPAMTSQSIDMEFPSVTQGYTMDTLDNVSTNLDTITPSLDSPYWNGGTEVPGGFGVQEVTAGSGVYASYYGTFTGSALTATLDTREADLNPGGRSQINTIKPIVTNAGSMTVTDGHRTLLSDAVTYPTAVSPSTRDGKAYMRINDVYHRGRVVITGGFDNAQGCEVEFTEAGRV